MLEHITLGPVAKLVITGAWMAAGAIGGIHNAACLEENLNKGIDHLNGMKKTLDMFNKKN